MEDKLLYMRRKLLSWLIRLRTLRKRKQGWQPQCLPWPKLRSTLRPMLAFNMWKLSYNFIMRSRSWSWKILCLMIRSSFWKLASKMLRTFLLKPFFFIWLVWISYVIFSTFDVIISCHLTSFFMNIIAGGKITESSPYFIHS